MLYLGRIEAFDTDHFTETLPCRGNLPRAPRTCARARDPSLQGNLLTNYALDASPALEGGSVWLRAYWHETAEPYREVKDEAGLPIARRRDGWSFLIADARDVAALERLTVDGELVLVRMAGELVDATALMRVYDEADDLGPKAVTAHAYLEASLGDGETGDPESLICNRMGMTRKCHRSVEAIQTSITENGSDTDGNLGD